VKQGEIIFLGMRQLLSSFVTSGLYYITHDSGTCDLLAWKVAQIRREDEEMRFKRLGRLTCLILGEWSGFNIAKSRREIVLGLIDMKTCWQLSNCSRLARRSGALPS